MSPEVPSKDKLKAEYILILNLFQVVRKHSSRLQGFTIDMQKISQLLPNKIPKQLNQYSNWKIKSAKLSADFFSNKQIEVEFNVKLN